MDEGKPAKAKWWSRSRAQETGATGDHAGSSEDTWAPDTVSASAGLGDVEDGTRGIEADRAAAERVGVSDAEVPELGVRRESVGGDYELERPESVPAGGGIDTGDDTGTDTGNDFELARPGETPAPGRGSDEGSDAGGDFELERPASVEAAGTGSGTQAGAGGSSSSPGEEVTARLGLEKSAPTGETTSLPGGGVEAGAPMGGGAMSVPAAGGAMSASGVADASDARPAAQQPADGSGVQPVAQQPADSVGTPGTADTGVQPLQYPATQPTAQVERPKPLHDPDPYSTPPYGEPGPWAPAPPVQHPATTPAHGTSVQAGAPAYGLAGPAEAAAHGAPTSAEPMAHGGPPSAGVPAHAGATSVETLAHGVPAPAGTPAPGVPISAELTAPVPPGVAQGPSHGSPAPEAQHQAPGVTPAPAATYQAPGHTQGPPPHAAAPAAEVASGNGIPGSLAMTPAHGTSVPPTATPYPTDAAQPAPATFYAEPSQPAPAPPYADTSGTTVAAAPYSDASGTTVAAASYSDAPHAAPAAAPYADPSPASQAAVQGTQAAPPGPWQNYDPWAGSGALQQNGAGGGGDRQRKRGRKVLVLGAVLLALVAGGIGGAVGAYLERNGGVGEVELPQSSDGLKGRAPDSVAGIAASALPGVVTLHVRGREAQGTGTGFVLDKRGHILTNNHVVEPAGSDGDITVTFSGGETAEATVVGRDSGYDLAVVKVSGVSGLKPLPLGNSDEVQVGDPVVAIGAPFDLANTVTSGIISAKERPITAGGDGGDASDVSYVDALQTDAPINPGNSGGPLVDASAHVIGINSAIRSAGSSDADGGQAGSIGLGFAIPINQGKRVAEELINTGKATHPVIGVTLDMDYSGDGARIGTEGSGGGSAVNQGGPADKAGLRSGDVITEVDGQRVHSGDELIVKVRAHRPGDDLELTVERDGKERKVSLTLGSSDG
ncbi:hypothetical protein SGFS_044680 [Streptomyces graminofaciens]|uniref:PDZ domain-containing protein n=1 Tax=Streptomyces graminofaciens TaxID=68212 RepID=A0ABM7F9M9_9ACTN|nr:trypsin-like peptidase domain-containing protein [Streptomyces graminofaciens]BBC33174.1 hypothetical protein SGFS_044680 [Streptomyces graminofaciens]